VDPLTRSDDAVLHLDDRWIWDFWLVDDGPDHHVFYLQAPRSLGDPELRHRNATIGHAVSSDLRSWHQLPDALGPGPAGRWDDGAPWTGSVIRSGGRWVLAYTGTCTGEGGLVQRVGLAVSDDLARWERNGDLPAISADRRWYERLGDGEWFDEAWRDPWLMADPISGDTLAFICARTAEGPTDERGAVGLARSPDLEHWTVEQPVYAPGPFAQVEVPQVVEWSGRWHLLFCTGDTSHSARWRRRRPAATTTYAVTGTGPTGPFTTDPTVLAAADGTIEYAGKLHRHGKQLVYMATVLHDDCGAMVGDLADPRPVVIAEDGRLAVIDEPAADR
jgi:beta-fructofuranosidase